MWGRGIGSGNILFDVYMTSYKNWYWNNKKKDMLCIHKYLLMLCLFFQYLTSFSFFSFYSYTKWSNFTQETKQFCEYCNNGKCWNLIGWENDMISSPKVFLVPMPGPDFYIYYLCQHTIMIKRAGICWTRVTNILKIFNHLWRFPKIYYLSHTKKCDFIKHFEYIWPWLVNSEYNDFTAVRNITKIWHQMPRGTAIKARCRFIK